MVTIGCCRSELCRVVYRVGAVACDGSGILREYIDRQGDEVSAYSEFRFAFHRLAVAHVIFRQHKEAVFGARLQRNFRHAANRINIVQLVGVAVDGIVEFVLFDAAAAGIVLTCERGRKHIGTIGGHRKGACGRNGIDGVHPSVGGDGLVDIEHDGGGGRNRVARDAIVGIGLDGASDKAFAAVQRIVDGQEAEVNVCGWQARGGVYGLEYPEGLVVNNIQPSHHIQEDAHRIPQINAGLVARGRALHGEDVTAKAETPYAEGSVIELLVQWHGNGDLARRRHRQLRIVLEIDGVGQTLRSRHPPQRIRALWGIVSI